MSGLKEYTVIEKWDGLPVRTTLVHAKCHARALHRCISMFMSDLTTYQVLTGNKAGMTAKPIVVND